jgi:hypothetical protein
MLLVSRAEEGSGLRVFDVHSVRGEVRPRFEMQFVGPRELHQPRGPTAKLFVLPGCRQGCREPRRYDSPISRQTAIIIAR